VAAVAGWVTSSSLFDARTVAVTGNRHLSRPQILGLAQAGPGTNLVWFSPGRVAGRLERSPWISSAHVWRALPSTLTIAVTERTALAVAVTDGDRRYLVAGDGTVLAIAGARGRLPEIQVRGSLRIGAKVAANTPGLEVLTAMTAFLRSDVQRVFVDRTGQLIVTLDGGTPVVYGDASGATEKARAVSGLLAWAARHGVVPTRLDVRVPDHPALLPGRHP